MIPYKEVKVLDLNTEALGIPTLTLMENAGTGLAEEIRKLNSTGKRVLFLCGTGNNGGDGLVAARHLARECSVHVVILGEAMKTDISRRNHAIMPDPVQVEHISVGSGEWHGTIARAIRDADIIVDSMLGVGITGTLIQPFHFAVEEVNGSGKRVVSVDVPTGFGGDLAIDPDITVTFHDTKPGMHGRVPHDSEEARGGVGGSRITSTNCGTIVVLDIGIPLEAEKYVGVGDFGYYPIPGKGFHKGNNGIVLIVGGGPFTGAPALAGKGALRAGSDLVQVAVPSRAYPIIASMSEDLIVHPLSSRDHLTVDDVDAILSYAFRAHAVLIGPGLGKHKETVAAVQKLADEIRKPLVIDADAIYSLKDVKFHGNTIFTPHRSEFTLSFEDSKLASVEPTRAALSQRVVSELDEEVRRRTVKAMTYARTHGGIVVQKGSEDIITDGERVKFNRTGNPGMTVGGTGDVLAGVIVSLLARGLEPFNAGRLGTYVTGRAGDLAFMRSWYSLTASDVVNEIPGVFQEVFGVGQ